MSRQLLITSKRSQSRPRKIPLQPATQQQNFQSCRYRIDMNAAKSLRFETLSLLDNSLSEEFAEDNSLSTPFEAVDVQSLAEPEDFVPRARFGIATEAGGRPYQDDRSTAFSTHLPDGRRVTVGAVLDGHHGHQLAELIADKLPLAFVAAVSDCSGDLEQALASTVRRLDDVAFDAHASGTLATGGTTLIIHALAGSEIFTANVGDCKAMLSSRGAPEALSEAHNPPVDQERQRFAAAGVPCFSDHIGECDINVCRTVGDYDLGPPLKWRSPSGAPCGPLISEPEITVTQINPIDEFIVTASDGLWDYYTPETTVVTEARRRLRSVDNDAQATAEWLVAEALQRQRGTLHAGTPGDNVTVMVLQLRPLPAIPRTSASRLNLKRAPSDLKDSPAAGAGILNQEQRSPPSPSHSAGQRSQSASPPPARE